MLSVGGSLAYYVVKKEGENAYKASLKPNSGKRDDVPETIVLEKTDGQWKAVPWHQEIISGLTHCIETGV